MRNLLLAATALGFAALAPAAHATVQIIGFGETATSTGITATETTAGLATHFAVTNDPITITQIQGNVISTPAAAFMQLSADSIDAAALVGGVLIMQHYSGTFCISSVAGCSGIDYLSGSFTDVAIGLSGGSQLSINISSPPDTLSLTSAVGLATASPSSLTFSLSNVSPALSIDTVNNTKPGTIGAFHAFYTGDADATPAPEPASLALLGVGLLGLGFVANRKRS